MLLSPGAVDSITDRVELMDLELTGSAPRAKRLFRADDLDVDKNKGTTKVFAGKRGEPAEFVGVAFDLHRREMLLTALCRSSRAGGKSERSTPGSPVSLMSDEGTVA